MPVTAAFGGCENIPNSGSMNLLKGMFQNLTKGKCVVRASSLDDCRLHLKRFIPGSVLFQVCVLSPSPPLHPIPLSPLPSHLSPIHISPRLSSFLSHVWMGGRVKPSPKKDVNFFIFYLNTWCARIPVLESTENIS